MTSLRIAGLVGLATVLATVVASADNDQASYTRKEDVIYGRKFGTALTLDVLTPRKGGNGAGVVWVISGGWFSNHDAIHPAFVKKLLDRGYTVFAVVHGCQPKFTIPEILPDLHRAVRFIRLHAREYGVDPKRLGITGGSAGGHLSLMQGTAGAPGDAKAKDPVDRVSSRVQAVACFFPPTDFLNYGAEGRDVFHFERLDPFRACFDFHQFDPKDHEYQRITDEKKVREILRDISPVSHVTADDAPTLIIHGDKDRLVPIQQAEEFIARLKKVGVPARLVVKSGADHGWPHLDNDLATCADWFDTYLASKK
jgi:acetyl esterase/lipase